MSNKTKIRNKARSVTILSLNVGRGAQSHEIAVNQAYLSDIDIILIQEPYIFHDRSRRITKHHPGYHSFSPNLDWNSHKPRVITYIRKGLGLHASQIYISSNDIVILRLTSSNGKILNIFNIYNAPYNPNIQSTIEILYTLPRISLQGSCLLQGDFNLHHTRWQPSLARSPTPGSEQFVEWLEDNNFNLISPQDKSTHNRGNVLDLALGSGPLLRHSKCCIATHLDATSDHLPLLTTIGWCNVFKSHQRLRPDTLDTVLFLKLLKSSISRVTSDSNLLTTEYLDKLAEDIIQSLQLAYFGAARRSFGHGKGNPWWDSSCKLARRTYKSQIRSALDPEEQKDAKKEYRKIIKKAKEAFFRAKVEHASTSKDIFAVTKWHKSRGTYRSTPLVDPRNPERPLATTTEEKRQVLLNNLLSNPTEVCDIPFQAPTVPIRSVPFPTLTLQEIQNSLLRAGNTAPGSDEIPTCILKIAWPLIKESICVLFSGCLSIGHHPKCFRNATVVILQKPNKSDLSSPRSYRPIALLSVLGKGLERLIAKRLSWISVKYKILESQQLGALPCRSAVDLTTCLTHDVERALYEGRTASMLTLDVKGAFDAVLPGRLVRRLREQGWPDNLVKWVHSFATDRKVQIRLDDETGPPQSLACGLPQGSPVSPILFMLYISPLFKIDCTSKKFGYADDIAILATQDSLSENCSVLTRSLAEALEWGQAEGITFDPEKSELQHFSRRRKDKDPALTPSITIQNISVSENTRRPYTKWLGVYFDKALSFKWHVRILAQKALKVVNSLRSLMNTSKGALPQLVRQAAIACIFPIVFYAAETWWPGHNKTTKTGHIVSNRVEGHLNFIRKVVLACARAILPVYRTTPIPILYKESGLLPPDIELNKRSRKAILRIHQLDPRHPLRKRINWVAKTRQTNTRLGRWALSIPEVEYIDPLINPPWTHTESWYTAIKRVTQTALSLPIGIPPHDLIVYTDASREENSERSRVGGGVVIYQAGQQIFRKSFPLNPYLSVFDAEAAAAVVGLEEALKLPTSRFSNDMWILLDNQNVARYLLQTPVCSSQNEFISSVTQATAWTSRIRLPHTSPGRVRVHWIPSHTSIQGNCEADRAAKEALILPHQAAYTTHTILTIDSAKSWVKERLNQEIKSYWTQHAPESYRTLGIGSFVRCPRELTLPRSLVAHIYAARSGHGDYAAYHERFHHEDALTSCSCGAPKSPHHIFHCTKPRIKIPSHPRKIGDAAKYYIGTFIGAARLVKWMEETKFFIGTCPREHKRNNHQTTVSSTTE